MSASTKDLAVLAPALLRISAMDRGDDATSYTALRDAAVESSQAASGERWTDYNTHDPGVTLLEADCYALTEIGYRFDFAVPDHLCGVDGAIDGRRQGLFAAPDIFPCAATTASDICQIILDANRDILDVRLYPAGEGLQRLILLANIEGQPGDFDRGLKRAAAQSYREHRGLGEDIEADIGTIRIERCQLILDAQLTGTGDPAKVLAEIFDACNELISPKPHVDERVLLMAGGASLESLYSGPRTKSGIIALADGVTTERRVSASQFRKSILAVHGVSDIGRLDFQLEARLGAVGTVQWDGQLLSWDASTSAPKLYTPHISQALAIEHISLRHPARTPSSGARSVDRDTAVMMIDSVVCAARYEDLRAKRLQGVSRGTEAKDPGAELPRGTPMSPPPYRSIGSLLPPVYGLAEPLNPDDQRPPGQLAIYVALFDQLLANSSSLVDHLGDLFSCRVRDDTGALQPSHWPDVLSNHHIPGIELLYARGEAAMGRDKSAATLLDGVREAAFDGRDHIYRRRNRILDFLLALYGEQVDQGVFGPFLDYCDFHELSAELLDIKSAYLAQVDVLTRDRATGRNYALPPWSSGSTPGFHLRIALKLGFTRPESRRLARCGETPAPDPVSELDDARMVKLVWCARDVVPPPSAGDGPVFAALNKGDPVSPVLLRRGLDRRHYSFVDQHLCLATEDKGGLVSLGRYDDAEAAGRAAQALRRALLEQTRASEGLHVIEHVLLRHRLKPETRKNLALRVSVVLPKWTTRTSRSDFQSFAEAIIRAECSAHLVVSCLWLDHGDMVIFEDALERWYQALADHVSERPDRANVDDAADGVWVQIERRRAGAA